jgi:hypothetical protein
VFRLQNQQRGEYNQPLPLWNPQQQGIPPLGLIQDDETSNQTLQLGFQEMKTSQYLSKLNQSGNQEGRPRRAQTSREGKSRVSRESGFDFLEEELCPLKEANRDVRNDGEIPSRRIGARERRSGKAQV